MSKVYKQINSIAGASHIALGGGGGGGGSSSSRQNRGSTASAHQQYTSAMQTAGQSNLSGKTDSSASGNTSLYSGEPAGSALRGNNNTMIKDRERSEKEMACDKDIIEGVSKGAIAGAVGSKGNPYVSALAGAGGAAAEVVVSDNCLDLI